MIAALFVEKDGCYYGLPDVDPWDQARDARAYAGPYPVVAHPPCQRWGRFWHGSTRKPHQFKLGDDGGCFAYALTNVRKWGGVLEHPADSHAWHAFDLNAPPRSGGWIVADIFDGWTCCVYQGHYGHVAGKPTWLYVRALGKPADLRWGKCEQRVHPVALAKHGYAKARRIGMMAMVGGKDKTKIRNATPIMFRDVLLTLADQSSGDKFQAPDTGQPQGHPLGPNPEPSSADAPQIPEPWPDQREKGWEPWPELLQSEQHNAVGLNDGWGTSRQRLARPINP